MRRFAGAGDQAPDGRVHSARDTAARPALDIPDRGGSAAPNFRPRPGLEVRNGRGPGRVDASGRVGSERSNCGSRKRPDLGTSVVGTLIGFVILMTLLLFCAQVLVRLYASSTLTSVAARAAEEVAESPDPLTEMPLAVSEAQQQLGTFGATRTRFQWLEVDAQRVVLEVRGDSPSLLPMPGEWSSITKTVTIRTERFR